MSKRAQAIIATAIAIIMMALLMMSLYQRDIQPQVIGGERYHSEKKIKMELANTPELWERGLTGHPKLDDEHGMLFDFGSADKRCMWNKGIQFDIDVGFFGANWEAMGNTTMPAYSEQVVCSPGAARYVVEMRGGWFKDHTKEGKK